MRFFEFLKKGFLVRQCVICLDPIDYDRKLAICDDCKKYWISTLDLLCDKCGYESEYCICTNKRMMKSVDFTAFCIFYKKNSDNPTKQIIYRLKKENIGEIFEFCAELMVTRARKEFHKRNLNINEFYVTYPTRRKRSAARYGYDHSKEIARLFAKKIGIPLMTCFNNSSKKEQKKLDREERYSNAKESYSICEKAEVKNKNFIIIDDVITTGSTLNACATLLKRNGAGYVASICFAKDI